MTLVMTLDRRTLYHSLTSAETGTLRDKSHLLRLAAAAKPAAKPAAATFAAALAAAAAAAACEAALGRLQLAQRRGAVRRRDGC